MRIFFKSKKRISYKNSLFIALFFIISSFIISSCNHKSDDNQNQGNSNQDKVKEVVIDQTNDPLPIIAPELPKINKEDFIYPDYYVQQKNIIAGDINLLAVDHVQEKFPLPIEKYDRVAQFGGWIDRSNDSSCMNTRGLVLQRDSDGPVQVSASCSVTTGLWHEPYTGIDYTSATKIQIDHVVPLEHAYMTGAFEWDYKKRCLYANYMGNKFHLLSVSGHENQSKGDRSPSEYMPPNKNFSCQYLKDWLEIKYIWNLKITPTELRGIRNLVKLNSCDIENFKIDQNEYQNQLTYINDNRDLCSGAKLLEF